MGVWEQELAVLRDIQLVLRGALYISRSLLTTSQRPEFLFIFQFVYILTTKGKNYHCHNETLTKQRKDNKCIHQIPWIFWLSFEKI